MSNAEEVIGTAEAATLLGTHVRHIARMVERGDLVPLRKLPGLRGSFVFRRGDVEAKRPDNTPAA